MSLQQLLRILAARRRLLFAVFAGMTALGAILALVLPRAYTATVDLVIDVKAPNTVLGAMLPPQMVSSYMKTQTDILTSREVLERAAARPEVAKDAALIGQWRDATGGSVPFATWFGRLLAQKIDLEPGHEGNMIVLTYTCPDAEQCARVANAVAGAFIDTNLAMKVDPAKNYASWFDARTKSMRDKVEAAQRKLSEYQQKHGIVATDERVDVETARLDELTRQLVTAQADRSASRSRDGQTARPDTVPEVVQSPLITGLKSDLARVEGDLAQAASRLGPKHPERVRLERQAASLRARIGAETSRIVGSLGTSDRVNAAREAEIQAAVDAQKQRVLALKAQRDEVAVLQQDLTNAQHNYDLVTGRLAETSLESQADQTNVYVLSPASAPQTPSRPKVPLLVALSAALGLFLGVAAVIALEIVRRRVRSEVDVVDALGIPVLAVLPRALTAPPRALLGGPR